MPSAAFARCRRAPCNTSPAGSRNPAAAIHTRSSGKLPHPRAMPPPNGGKRPAHKDSMRRKTQPRTRTRSQHTQQSAHASPGASSSGREAAASNQRQAQPPKAQPAVSAPPAAVRPANPVTDIFQMLFRDSDRTLLLALILILSEEKSDPGLLFALLYIAL